MSTRNKDEKATYLTFYLDNEVYAVNVLNVREVLELDKITQVPKMPDFMRGVINVRGSVIPVVDLKLKFGMQKVEDTIETCIVVTEIPVDDQLVVLGCLADSVEEVIDLEPDQIEPTPQIGTAIDTRFIEGIGKKEGEFILILDMNSIFSEKEIELVHRADKERKVPVSVKE